MHSHFTANPLPLPSPPLILIIRPGGLYGAVTFGERRFGIGEFIWEGCIFTARPSLFAICCQCWVCCSRRALFCLFLACCRATAVPPQAVADGGVIIGEDLLGAGSDRLVGLAV